ncbi:HupE/UreJ family protein [Pseudoalteromonas denitrificans]|uniref:HupE / UreJ protein n=1 Tax=Pseudoalteromonas denitrificans DSM 6059 TaxID=1123010 RepID=A0A1I1N2A4_9GAMM|nr:HupE/UreJ family protein [Pseudoalteromonas denitrificans]SFC91771.1 HupE / UreJ protein [Pseudoalteromonas denitrificans DSM 6059]
MNNVSLNIMRCVLVLLGLFASFNLFAHGVDENTKQFLTANQGVSIIPFIYIGAKHMVTGYDHLLFLVGVIFFLFRTKDVVLYVSLFTLGHSVTLLLGVLNDIQVNAYLIDAIIALSIVYKGFDNLGGFKRLFDFQPNTKAAVMIFGLFHGFGLATKIQEFKLPDEGLVANIIAFNVGVEVGQFMALGLVLILMSFWRRHSSYMQFSTMANTLLMSGGLMLFGLQVTGFFINR